MGIKDELENITNSAVGTAKEALPRPSSRVPRTAPGQMLALSSVSRGLEEELEKAKQEAGAPRQIALSSIRPSPYQIRAVDPVKVADLKANILANGMSSPVVVREIAPGAFEMVAGHHREAVFHELGRETIPAIVVKLTDEQAERSVFFDNFFPPELSDYQRFLGLHRIQQRHHHTHEALAQNAGISRQLVSLLMSFDKLSTTARELLNEYPALIGASVAAALVQLGEAYSARVTEGLRLVASGELKQSKLVDWVTQRQAPTRPEPIVVKSGRSVYAKILRRDRRVTVDFTNIDDAEALEQEISVLLKQRASPKKS